MPTFRELLDQPSTTLPDLSKHLASLPSDTRIHECRALGKKQQRRLWALAESGEPLSPEHMVETAAAQGEPVRWYGRNTLPAFVLFEKRFRLHEGRVVGINVQPLIQWLTGPGYFTCRIDDQKPRELLIDYTLLPTSNPEGWPVVKSNKAGFSRFIYYNMYDYCRMVSPDVVIGAATRLGKPIDQYFVLCRAAREQGQLPASGSQ